MLIDLVIDEETMLTIFEISFVYIFLKLTMKFFLIKRLQNLANAKIHKNTLHNDIYSIKIYLLVLTKKFSNQLEVMFTPHCSLLPSVPFHRNIFFNSFSGLQKTFPILLLFVSLSSSSSLSSQQSSSYRKCFLSSSEEQ